MPTHRSDMHVVLAHACDLVGLDHDGAELVRCVNNAVYRLKADPLIVRITLTPGMARRARAAVTAARLLAAHQVPAVELMDGVPQPVRVGDHLATFWRLAVDTGRAPTARQLADLLLRLHRIPAVGVPLPSWDPITDLRTRIHDARCDGWAHSDVDLLSRRCDAVETALATVRYELPLGVIHGDAQTGNVISTPAGPVLCDLDTVCFGPREWDLIPVAVRQLRFRPAAGVHHELATAYGFDVTHWPGFPVLREIRELKLAAVGMPIARDNRSRLELRRRLHSIRTGDTSTPWTPYP